MRTQSRQQLWGCPRGFNSIVSPRVLALLRARGARQICARSALRAPFRADGGPNAVQRWGPIRASPTDAFGLL